MICTQAHAMSPYGMDNLCIVYGHIQCDRTVWTIYALYTGACNVTVRYGQFITLPVETAKVLFPRHL